ncbi:hypothetical protein Bca101_081242 [Brassica carinata]
MDTYRSRVTACVAPFDSEAAAKERAFFENYTGESLWIQPSKVSEDEIKTKLTEHFKSCGQVCGVDFPKEPLLDRRAFVILRGYGAKEKALQLNGSDVGDWNALVKFAQEEEEEFQVDAAYREYLLDELLNDERFRFGICVQGFDTSLSEDEVKRALTAHFSSCGEIVHVYVNLTDKMMTNIYFSEEEGEARAMDLDGSQVDGFIITTRLVATTVRSNTPLPPAHMLEFGHEIQERNEFHTTEWKLISMIKKLRALKKQKAWALREPKFKALRWPKAKSLKKLKGGALKKLKAWALRKLKAKALKKQKARARARRERGHSPFEKERMLM